MNGPLTSSTRFKIRNGFIIFGLLFVLCIQHHSVSFYSAENVESSYLLDSKGFSSDFSALQAEALFHGRLEVLPTPPDLLLVSDPYDPEQNAPFRGSGYHDLSFFEGKIYAPQGFGAALLIDIPTRLIGLGYASPPLKVLLLVAAGTFSLFLICVELLGRIQKKSLTNLQNIVLLSIVLLSNPATWLIVSGRSYHVPIAAAYFAINTGVLVAWKGIGNRRLGLVSSGAFLIGLAFMARPNIAPLVFSAVFVLGFYCFKICSKGSYLQYIFLICLCIGAVVTLWGLLNYARFENYTQTGHAYQLSGFNMRNYPIGSLDFILENVKAYILTPVQFHRDFPFFYLTPSNANESLVLQQHEDLAGLLFAYPLLCFTPISTVVVFRKKLPFLSLSTLSIATSIATLVFISAIFKDSTMRYLPDFSTGLVMVSAITLPLYFKITRDKPVRNILSPIVALCFVAVLAIEFNLLLSQCQRC
jgi:hypothetical protein